MRNSVLEWQCSDCCNGYHALLTYLKWGGAEDLGERRMFYSGRKGVFDYLETKVVLSYRFHMPERYPLVKLRVSSESAEKNKIILKELVRIFNGSISLEENISLRFPNPRVA